MEIIRIYNNNVAVVKGNGDCEMIVIGKGLVFQKKPGDLIDQEKIEKKFTLEDQNIMAKLKEMISEIPSVYLTISEEIVEMIRKESDLTLSENIYITLTDHISMSLEREKRGVVLENPLLLEIRQFYKKEFSLAQKAANVIERHLDLKVSEDEIGFITLHIVNASMNQRFENTMKATRIIQDILSLVRDFYQLPFDDASIRYDRFVRHLQFFARRVLGGDEAQPENDFFYRQVRDQFPQAAACVRLIKDHMKKKYGKNVTDAERGYLIYHIASITAEHQENSY